MRSAALCQTRILLELGLDRNGSSSRGWRCQPRWRAERFGALGPALLILNRAPGRESNLSKVSQLISWKRDPG